MEDYKDIYYGIAGLILKLHLPKDFDIERNLNSFKDFELSEQSDYADISVELTMGKSNSTKEPKKLLSDVSQVWGGRFLLEESENQYYTKIKSAENEEWEMHSSKDFKTSSIFAGCDDSEHVSHLSWLLMVAFGQHLVFHRGILIHASVIEKEGIGYAFLGKSGTGKSTHSRLWLKHINGTDLLNDDNPIIRILENNEVRIYGTPWSGKTACYKNRHVRLQGLSRLQQAGENQWKKIIGKEALLQVLPSCTGLRWNSVIYNHMLDTVEYIISHVQVGYLACLPDQGAAELNYKRLTFNS